MNKSGGIDINHFIHQITVAIKGYFPFDLLILYIYTFHLIIKIFACASYMK
jgi:hypothetical protein